MSTIMGLYYCGFNGYKQITNADKIISKLTKIKFGDSNISDIYMHQSYSVLKVNKNLYKLGYSTKEDNLVTKKLVLNEVEEVKQILCDEEMFFLLDNSGILFKYTDETNFFRIDNLCDVGNNIVAEELPIACDPIRVTHVTGGKGYIAFTVQSHDFYIGSTKLCDFDEEIVDISSGFQHILILTALGNVYSWGHGSRGQLGHGELSNEDLPRLIEALAGIKITAICAGGWHSCAIGSLGDLYTWGSNEKGQLGLPVAGITSNKNCGATLLVNAETDTYNILAVPKLINFKDENFDVLKISCGSAHTIIFGSDMNLYGAGWNKYKQIGVDTGDVEIVNQFCKIESTLKFGPNIVLKCGPWSTAVILQ